MQTPSPELPERPEYVCPNCRQPYESIPELCPHCGFNIMRVPRPAFLLGSYPADVILALLLCTLCAPVVVTAIIPLILYFSMDKRYVGFRKGLAVGLILYVVIILGALALCGYIIFALGRGEHH
jgi:DNA-directed RNA polymerase subunit RPC12/RpoP